MKKILLLTAIYFLGIFTVPSIMAQNINWSVVDGIYGGTFQDVDFDPADLNTVYIGGINGIFKTVDGGENWIEKNNGLPLFSGEWNGVTCVVIDPNNTDIIFIMVNRLDALSGIYKSIDGGENWSLIKNFDTWLTFFSIDIEAGNSNTIYAAANGIFKSEDGGDNWEQIFATGKSIFIDPGNPDVLIAIIDDENGFSHLYKTIDGGVNWFDITNYLPDSTYIKQVAIDPSNSDTIYATTGRLYRSDNGGETWNHVGWVNDFTQGMIVIDKNSPNIVYSASEWGLYKSIDYGENWQTMHNVNGHTYIIGLSSDSNVLFGDDQGKLLKSSNQGKDWEIKQNGLISYSTMAIHFPQADSNRIMIGTGGAGLYISYNNGISWEQKYAGWDMLPNFIRSILTDPTDENIIYYNSGVDLFKSNNGGDGGSRLHVYTGGFFTSLAIDPQNTNILYCSTSDSGVYKSTDYGIAWEAVNNGISTLNVHVLAINPQNPNMLYAGTNEQSIFKTIDGGANWENIGENLGDLQCIEIDPFYPDTIYLGTIYNNIKVFRSFNGGESWDALYDSSLESVGIQDIVLDPEDPSILYLATGNGIFISNDYGDSWPDLNADIPDPNILCLGKRSGGLYAGTRSKGLLLGTITPVGINEEERNLKPDNFFLFQNYPNPFNAVTTISYQLPELSFVNLSIYNVTG